MERKGLGVILYRGHVVADSQIAGDETAAQ